MGVGCAGVQCVMVCRCGVCAGVVCGCVYVWCVCVCACGERKELQEAPCLVPELVIYDNHYNELQWNLS